MKTRTTQTVVPLRGPKLARYREFLKTVVKDYLPFTRETEERKILGESYGVEKITFRIPGKDILRLFGESGLSIVPTRATAIDVVFRGSSEPIPKGYADATIIHYYGEPPRVNPAPRRKPSEFIKELRTIAGESGRSMEDVGYRALFSRRCQWILDLLTDCDAAINTMKRYIGGAVSGAQSSFDNPELWDAQGHMGTCTDRCTEFRSDWETILRLAEKHETWDRLYLKYRKTFEKWGIVPET